MRKKSFESDVLHSLCWKKFIALDLPIDFQYQYATNVPNISMCKTIYTRQGFNYEELSNELVNGLKYMIDYIKPSDGKYLLMFKLLENRKECEANTFFSARFKPTNGKYWKEVKATLTIKAIFDTVELAPLQSFDIIL